MLSGLGRAALVEARALVKRGWTQEAYARDATGCPVFYGDEVAVAWCLGGAIHRTSAASNTYAEVIKELSWGRGSAIGWNDVVGRTQAEVLALIDRTLARAG